jgi:hypothetical protein
MAFNSFRVLRAAGSPFYCVKRHAVLNLPIWSECERLNTNAFKSSRANITGYRCQRGIRGVA